VVAFTEIISVIYGLVALLMSVVFIVMFLGNIGNNPIQDFNDVSIIAVMFLMISGFGLLGFLILHQLVTQSRDV
jgi:hypothetical protein